MRPAEKGCGSQAKGSDRTLGTPLLVSSPYHTTWSFAFCWGPWDTRESLEPIGRWKFIESTLPSVGGGLDLNCPGHVRDFPVSEACYRRPYNLPMSPIGWSRSPPPNSFPLHFQLIFIDSQRNENSLHLL